MQQSSVLKEGQQGLEVQGTQQNKGSQLSPCLNAGNLSPALEFILAKGAVLLVSKTGASLGMPVF